MSICESINLPELELETYQVTEVLRCLFHTIIFNRALGCVKPTEIDAELFDITWVHCGDQAADQKIEEKISQIQAWVERNPDKRVRVSFSFYERRHHQGWFARQEQRLYWEQWHLYLNLLPHTDINSQEHHSIEADAARAARKNTLQSALVDCLVAITTAVNKKKDHIPPVVSGSSLTFPFDIRLSSLPRNDHHQEQQQQYRNGRPISAQSLFGTGLMRRMLSAGSPPSVLY